jgi:hypothetical protein
MEKMDVGRRRCCRWPPSCENEVAVDCTLVKAPSVLLEPLSKTGHGVNMLQTLFVRLLMEPKRKL